jgi:hypothetical protein
VGRNAEEGTVAARLKTRSIFATFVALLAVGLSAPAAGAGGSLLGLNNDCGTTSRPFAQFGDYRNYTFGTNGGLENGGNGWSLSGSAVVPGNETFFAHSASDRYSLALPAGSSAVTPKLCMGTTSTVMRFFVKSNNGGSVRVEVVLRNLLGQVLGVFQISRLSPGATWEAGPSILNLDSLLGLLGISSVQLKFTTLSGSVQVDDVYVDPWASRN